MSSRGKSYDLKNPDPNNWKHMVTIDLSINGKHELVVKVKNNLRDSATITYNMFGGNSKREIEFVNVAPGKSDSRKKHMNTSAIRDALDSGFHGLASVVANTEDGPRKFKITVKNRIDRKALVISQNQALFSDSKTKEDEPHFTKYFKKK